MLEIHLGGIEFTVVLSFKLKMNSTNVTSSA